MKKITKDDHAKAYIDAAIEALEDAKVQLEISAAHQDAVVYGRGTVKVTEALDVEHIPYDPDDDWRDESFGNEED